MLIPLSHFLQASQAIRENEEAFLKGAKKIGKKRLIEFRKQALGILASENQNALEIKLLVRTINKVL